MLGWKALAQASLESLSQECEDIDEAEALREASGSESESPSGHVPLSPQTSNDSCKQIVCRGSVVLGLDQQQVSLHAGQVDFR